MHFVYKLDHLLRGMMVSDENSSTLKRLKLGMVSSFHPHSMCKKVEMVTAKTGCIRVQTGPSSSKYERFRTKTHQLSKGWNLAWYHNFTHIACVQKLRGLRQKQDALRVATGPSPSKCEGFRRKLICYKDIPFFKAYLNSRLFVPSFAI